MSDINSPTNHLGDELMAPSFNILNPLTMPLEGSNLIEASAGTGKTYTITTLYLRLLLGHIKQGKIVSGFTVEQILVVTFTEAATQEIRDRVRSRINEAKWAVFLGETNDPILAQLLENIEDKQFAFNQLDAAVKLMDQAAIFTIHGFCHRMLTQHAFESGILFEQEFILDQRQIIDLAVKDFWRKSVVHLPSDVLTFVRTFWKTPELLQKEIEYLIYKEGNLFSPSFSFSDVLVDLEKHIAQVKRLKSLWLDDYDAGMAVEHLLLASDLKANKASVKPDRLNAMKQFCDSSKVDFEYKASKKESFELWGQTFLADPANLKGKKVAPVHAAFELCEELAQTRSSLLPKLKAALIQMAVEDVKHNMAEQKRIKQQMSTDELLTLLHDALVSEGGNALAAAIAKQFPNAMIDEFQDTDPIQYTIFSSIYSNTQSNNDVVVNESEAQSGSQFFVMIGDPKQAIYGFRGADIFTYIQAKNEIDKANQFTLDTNWRSSDGVVSAVNHLFESSADSFIYNNDIPFLPVKSAGKASHKALLINKHVATSLVVSHLTSEPITGKPNEPLAKNNVQAVLAQHSANQIAQLLNTSGNSAITLDGAPLAASDICVLVRDRYEADAIKNALALRGLASVFLSKESVLETSVASELCVILQVLIAPQINSHVEKQIRAVLLSSLFNYSVADVQLLNTQESNWQTVIDSFESLKVILQTKGVMALIQHLIFSNQLAQKWQVLHSNQQVERQLTDLRHLAELLQEKQLELGGLHKLLYWYEQQVTEPESNNKSQQMRLESDQNLIQIVTMHACKGLEYNIVFLPFICGHRATKNAVFHDEANQLVVDLTHQKENVQQADKERLAEDLRLLYVALTRPVHQCYFNLFNPKLGLKKESGLLQSAIGHLLFGGRYETQITDAQIADRILVIQDALGESGLELVDINPEAPQVNFDNNNLQSSNDTIILHKFSQPIDDGWRVTSYSGLASHSSEATEEQSLLVKPGIDDELTFSNEQTGQSHSSNASSMLSEIQGQSSEEYDSQEHDRDLSDSSESHNMGISSTENQLTPFTFDKGANPGSCLHEIFENIEFTCEHRDFVEVVEQKLTLFGIDTKWTEVVHHWIGEVLDTKLNSKGLTLGQISNKLIEMEFHLSLTLIKSYKLNTILGKYLNVKGKNSRVPQLKFFDIQGVLKGFIDLIFEHKGQYFVLDYKSNHLGDSFAEYVQPKMEHVMCSHQYHLQYLIYLVALQRYLKVRIPDYDYDTHIGGVYYLFLRGMSPENNRYEGVFNTKPSKALIDELDTLFGYGEHSITGVGVGNNLGHSLDSDVINDLGSRSESSSGNSQGKNESYASQPENQMGLWDE